MVFWQSGGINKPIDALRDKFLLQKFAVLLADLNVDAGFFEIFAKWAKIHIATKNSVVSTVSDFGERANSDAANS